MSKECLQIHQLAQQSVISSYIIVGWPYKNLAKAAIKPYLEKREQLTLDKGHLSCSGRIVLQTPMRPYTNCTKLTSRHGKTLFKTTAFSMVAQQNLQHQQVYQTVLKEAKQHEEPILLTPLPDHPLNEQEQVCLHCKGLLDSWRSSNFSLLVHMEIHV